MVLVGKMPFEVITFDLENFNSFMTNHSLALFVE